MTSNGTTHGDAAMTATTLTPTATIETNVDGGILVRVTWTGAPLTRPSTGGWGLPATPRGRALAARLVAAVNAGKAISALGVATDVNGGTYVSSVNVVTGRRMAACLRSIGY